MKYGEFLTTLIDRGLSAARRDYARDEPKREGAVAGFEACRGLHPGDLAILVIDARRQQEAAYSRHQRGKAAVTDYWRARCYCAEIEWTANVVGAALTVAELRRHLELPSPFVEWRQPPVQVSARGATTASEIIGVRRGA